MLFKQNMSSVIDLLIKLDGEIVKHSEKQAHDLIIQFPEFEEFFKNLTKREKVILTA